MSLDRLKIYLDRMQQSALGASQYTMGMDKAAFLQDSRTQDAILAKLMAIGECVAKIIERYPDFVDEHSEVLWQDIKGMRNRIAHQYFELDADIVWETTQIMIPELLSQLESLRHWQAQGE
jgi:uncharacterized protein with HEPN domain